MESESAPSKRKPKEDLPGKENSIPDIERSSSPFSLTSELQPHPVYQAAATFSSNECINDHFIVSKASEHQSSGPTGKELSQYTPYTLISIPGIQDSLST